MQVRWLDGVVQARRRLTDRISEILIAGADGRALTPAMAGSHVELRFSEGDASFVRHYSAVGPLSQVHQAEPFWRIAVQREDRSRGSAYIHDRFGPGSHLAVSRPINALRLTNAPSTLLVAGGIGITPIVWMARSLLLRRQRFSLFYSGLERAAMAYADPLQAMCGERLTLHESRVGGIPDLSALLRGQPDGTVAYVCGPVAMIEALRNAAQTIGWMPGVCASRCSRPRIVRRMQRSRCGWRPARSSMSPVA